MGAALWRRRAREQRRARLRGAPFPEEWSGWLGRNLEIYRRLPPDQQQELQGSVQVFLDEKKSRAAKG